MGGRGDWTGILWVAPAYHTVDQTVAGAALGAATAAAFLTV
ncbi:hypothetical protein [Streptomyces sp. Isolate_219]|nr:hypothetical protein [Streptomyces sp. Isolate_219]